MAVYSTFAGEKTVGSRIPKPVSSPEIILLGQMTSSMEDGAIQEAGPEIWIPINCSDIPRI